MRLLVLSLVLLLAGGEPVAAPTRGAAPVGETSDSGRFLFHVETPAVELTRSPEGPFSISIEGFEVRSRAIGAPDVPTRIVRVAIPPDATPRLIVRAGPESARPGVRPRPTPRDRFDFAESAATDGDMDGEFEAPPAVERRRAFVQDDAIYRGHKLHPERVAWLGEIGTLRDQRYVEVHLAPVRFDPGIDGLRVAQSLEIEVVFDGWDPASGAPSVDPRFEGVYRNAFINYDQGRSFRVSEGSSGLSAVPLTGPEGAGIDSPTARKRIRIRANGVVRLDYATMSGTDFLPEPLSTWKLTSRGVEVPLHVRDDDADGFPEATDGNNQLDPGEWVQFYGQALDFEPKTALNTDVTGDIDLWEYLDASDENVYFLTVEGGPRSRMTTRDALPTHTRTPPASFAALARAEVDDAWRPLGGADPWYWSPTLFQPGTSSRTDTVPLPGIASTTAGLHVRVHLQGRSEYSAVFPDHSTLVTLRNGTNQVLTTDGDDGTFDGLELFTHDFTWTHSGGPQASLNVKIQLDALPTAAASNDVILDWIEIEYGRTFAASGDTLTFEWPDSDAEFVVTGLTTSATQVYEITEQVASSGVIDAVRLLAVEVAGSGPYSARFRIDDLGSGNPRRFAVAGNNAVTVPTGSDFTTDTVSDLRNTATQADLVVIAHRDLLDSPASCADAELTQLLALRASRGVSSKVACIDDVADEFNDGVGGPLAIRSFLAWVMSGSGWATPKPSYVLLLGDSSYDYKAGTANGTYVPTQIMFKEDPSIGYYGSDAVLAAVIGPDQLPDVTIGRLSVRTEAEADTILNKVRLYEQFPAGGNWLGNALLISDRGKAFDDFEAEEFERINDIGALEVTTAGLTARSMEYWSGASYCHQSPGACNPGVFRADLKDNINGDDPAFDGAAMAQFSGHGNFNVWSDDVLFCVDTSASYCPFDDTQDLANASRLPFLLVHNCLTGGFHSTALKSFGESWTKHAAGGAIAVLAPSGLGFRFIGEVVTGTVWKDVYGPTKERDLGMIALNNQTMLCGQNSIEACQYYVLLGDPSARLAIPAPAPPSNLAAVAGNGVVGLTWTASAEETLHNVYRSTQPGSGYVKHPGSPVTCPLGGGCAFNDGTVINAATYYYYVVARDAAGFEGPRSNYNLDCGTNGPDCVSAQPLNPNPPPPPASVTATDPETGGRLNVSWPVAASDVGSYTVYWGTSSGVYTAFQTVGGLNLQTSITGLQNGTTYFVAVKATNTSGHTSGFSPEDSEKPTFVQGLRAPALIEDLRLSKSGNNAVLSWGAVTQDIYERPKTIAFYEVYRGTSVQFVPAPGNRIAPSVTGTTFTDVGALTPGGPNYHYLVRAVGADASGGGLGGQLPTGINDLAVNRVGTCSITTTTVCRAKSECPGAETCQLSATNLLLSWTAVATDFDNEPTQIDHYEVYARATPFTREDVRQGLVPLLISVGGPSTQVIPPAGAQYYSVIAVDPRDNKSPF